MAEAGRPGASTPLAADDMIGSLAARVRELSLRVAQLEGELEAARRRIAVYEDFDAQVQDSLSAALRASQARLRSIPLANHGFRGFRWWARRETVAWLTAQALDSRLGRQPLPRVNAPN